MPEREAPEAFHRPETPPPPPPPAPGDGLSETRRATMVIPHPDGPRSAPPPAPVLGGSAFKCSATLDQFFAALAVAQTKLSQPTKTKTATVKGESRGGREYEYTYRYCDINDVLEAAKESLNAEGIAVYQHPEIEEKPYETTGSQAAKRVGAKVTVHTLLGHKSGQWTQNTIWAMAESCGPQAIGSVITYLRRYGLQLAAGIAADDDEDGNAGQGDQPGGPNAARNPGASQTAANPQPRGGANLGPENEEFTVVAPVGNVDQKPASQGRTQYLFYLPGQPKPASTVSKALAEKVLKERDSGMPLRWHLKRAGSFVNLEDVEVLPPGSLT